MPIYRGATQIDTLARGTVTPDKVYRGSTLVWPEDGPPPVFNGKKNDFAGIAPGTLVTPANSASGGDPFDSVETINGTVTARAGGAGVRVTAGSGVAFPQWLVPSSSVARTRHYFTTWGANPAAIMRQVNLRSGSTIRTQGRYNTAGRWEMTDGSGAPFLQTSTALALNTRHRVEVKWAPVLTDCELFVYVGEGTTPLPTVRYAGTNLSAWDRVGIGYVGGGSVISQEVLMEKYAWSPDGDTEIGPEL